MAKIVLWLTLIISIGIFSWVQQLPPAQKIKALVDRGKSDPLQAPEKFQKPFVLAAMMGPVEKRTPEYNVAPMDQPDKSPTATHVGDLTPYNEKKQEKAEKKVTPKPPAQQDRLR